MPNTAILLRWTAAIREKADKLLGTRDDEQRGYIQKGIVSPDEAYVIAVNGRLLRGSFPSITGISQSPSAVEAVFATGPFAIQIDRQTMEVTSSGHQYQPIVQEPSGSGVPAHSFFDPRFCPVSAILAADIGESWPIGGLKPMAVVHNPCANNPIPEGLLPANFEYAARIGQDKFSIDRRLGRLGQL
jgi:type I restriction enzyme S subunit